MGSSRGHPEPAGAALPGTGDPSDTSPAGEPPLAGRRRVPALIGGGLAFLVAMSFVPSPSEPEPPVPAPAAADGLRHPPAAGALTRAAEAASQPGVVWPPPGPLRDRQAYTSVWTGAHMMMWRGAESGRPLDGSAYASDERSWRPAAPAPIESRSHAAAIWDGREVLIWGGLSATGQPFADGAAYDPVTDRWRTVPASPLGARVPLVAAWTGREVLVVGARPEATTSSGPGLSAGDAAAYNPETGRWRRLAPLPVALTEAVAAWTGSELLVYGGLALPPGGADPAGRRPRSRGVPERPGARGVPERPGARGVPERPGGGVPERPGGGAVFDPDLARGAAYDPVGDRWRVLPVAPLSSPFMTAAWTGREFVAWDGARRSAAFDPRSGRWSQAGRVGVQRSG